MTITAKFDGTCKICGGPTVMGEKINWEKGKGAWHINCLDTKFQPRIQSYTEMERRNPGCRSPQP